MIFPDDISSTNSGLNSSRSKLGIILYAIAPIINIKMNNEEYFSYDALGLSELLRTKQISSSELLEVSINLTELLDPLINAVPIRHFDLARDQAKENSILNVLINIFKAALEARYPYQPPNLLSPILPTRALKAAKIEGEFLGKNLEKYFAISIGAIAFILK